MTTLAEFFETVEPKTDKGTGHSYIQQYYTHEFSNKKELPINLLEIGVRQGYSHYLWNMFFTNPETKILGIENGDSKFEYKDLLDKTRVVILHGDAYSEEMSSFFRDNYFDYIIDDGPHTIESQKAVIDLYMIKLKIGGKLIIEDLQGMAIYNEILKYISEKGYSFKSYDFVNILGRTDDLLIEITKT